MKDQYIANKVKVQDKNNSIGITTSSPYKHGEVMSQDVLWESRKESIRCKCSEIFTPESVGETPRKSNITARLEITHEDKKTYGNVQQSHAQLQADHPEEEHEDEKDDIEEEKTDNDYTADTADDVNDEDVGYED
jgi:hypothetical protein